MVISLLLFVCGEQKGRKRSELRKQRGLGDKIWQVQRAQYVKQCVFSSSEIAKCVFNLLPRVNNLTSLNTQKPEQECTDWTRKNPLLVLLSGSFQF